MEGQGLCSLVRVTHLLVGAMGTSVVAAAVEQLGVEHAQLRVVIFMS